MKNIMNVISIGAILVILLFISIGLSPAIIESFSQYLQKRQAESIIEETFKPSNNKAVVGILMNNGQASCSGVQIDSKIVLTANHCVADGNVAFGKLEVFKEEADTPNLSYAGLYYVVYREPLLDFAIISSIPSAAITDQVKREIFKTTLRHLRAPVAGEKVDAVGFRFGETKVISTGFVDDGLPYFHSSLGFFSTRISTWIDGGMSGGPVYGKDGKIVGLNSIGFASALKIKTFGDGLRSAYIKYLTRFPGGMTPFYLVVAALKEKLREV